jgi:hypothetical protein
VHVTRVQKAVAFSIPLDLDGHASLMSLHFTLLDTSPSLVEEWKNAFTKHATVSMTVSFIQSQLADLVPPESQFDCIVSPANSYGRLDGGSVSPISQSCNNDNLVVGLTTSCLRPLHPPLTYSPRRNLSKPPFIGVGKGMHHQGHALWFL